MSAKIVTTAARAIYYSILFNIWCISSLKWPKFSWDHVPVYIHMCNTSGVWNDTTLQYFTKYPLITFEKGQGVNATDEPYASLYAEDKIVNACKQIKAIDPSITCIFYYNSVYDWTFYKLHETFIENPSWWLRDDNGNIVLSHGDKSFPQPVQGMLSPDYRQQTVQHFWASECLNITNKYYGIVDGCFIDKGQKNIFNGYNFTAEELHMYEIGHNATIASIQAALNASNSSILIVDKAFVPPGAIATMVQWSNPTEEDINQLLSFSEKGVLVEVHGSNDCITNVTDSLAAFLIGANEYSYYACSNKWLWPDNWNIWYPEYDYPLGKPLAPAVKQGTMYSRSFASGTNVTFDVSINKGEIVWASTG